MTHLVSSIKLDNLIFDDERLQSFALLSLKDYFLTDKKGPKTDVRVCMPNVRLSLEKKSA